MSHFRNPSNCSKILGKVISKSLHFEKTYDKLPWDDRTDSNFIAPLTMYFFRSKSTLDSLKSVFNVFRRKLSLGATVQ